MYRKIKILGNHELTDGEWEAVRGTVETCRRRRHSLRDVVEAALWVEHRGEDWRSLPKRYPPWQTVFYYYNKWRSNGKWDQVKEALAGVRVAA